MRDPRLTEHAKAMRHQQTEPEMRLWLALRGNRFEGVKFRRQKVIGRYIVDFAANEPKLIVEVDGDTHGDTAHRDGMRTAYLQEQGYQVVRFTNSNLMNNIEGILTQVSLALHTPPLPTLSPQGERAL